MDADIKPRGGNFASIQIFLVVSTCFLYLVAAGLFSKAVWLLEMDKVNSSLPIKLIDQIADRIVVE